LLGGGQAIAMRRARAWTHPEPGAGMDVSVEHDSAAGRFQARVDGHCAVLDYRLADGIMTLTHTGVPEAIEGRGVAASLMRAALDEARAQGWRVVPKCKYAEDFLRKHGEYADLRAQ
ncbi:MAG: GNAT family N-acetyltransferase, partial [Arenimonas sp.]